MQLERLRGDPGPADITRIANSDVTRVRQDRSFTETENAMHRIDHAMVESIVARTRHLPPVIAFTIWLHHDSHVLRVNSIPADVRPLVALAAVAAHLVADFGGYQPSVNGHSTQRPAWPICRSR